MSLTDLQNVLNDCNEIYGQLGQIIHSGILHIITTLDTLAEL